MKTLDPAALTRADKLALIYRHTHRDYKGSLDGHKSLLVYRGGTALVLLDHLTDAEIEDKLPYAIKKETERLNKPEYYATGDYALSNGSGFRVRNTREYAHYINGDFIRFLTADEFNKIFEDYAAKGTPLIPFTKKEAKALLPAGMGGNVGF